MLATFNVMKLVRDLLTTPAELLVLAGLLRARRQHRQLFRHARPVSILVAFEEFVCPVRLLSSRMLPFVRHPDRCVACMSACLCLVLVWLLARSDLFLSTSIPPLLRALDGQQAQAAAEPPAFLKRALGSPSELMRDAGGRGKSSASSAAGGAGEGKSGSSSGSDLSNSTAAAMASSAQARLRADAPFFVGRSLWPPMPGEPLRKPVAALYLGVLRAADLVDDAVTHRRRVGRALCRVALPALLLAALLALLTVRLLSPLYGLMPFGPDDAGVAAGSSRQPPPRSV